MIKLECKVDCIMESNVNPNKIFGDILSRLLRDELDEFEVLNMGNKYSVNLANEESLSKQKYLLQKFILQQLLKMETIFSNYHSRLLKETESHLNWEVPDVYLCCFVGCLHSSPRHRMYLQHLKAVHYNSNKLVCNFKKTCKREYPRLSLLLEHVLDSHSVAPTERRQVQEDIPCKCNMVSCSGVNFRNAEELMTHFNVKHSNDERNCIFDNCSYHFSAGSNSRNHFRLKHKKTNLMKMKSQHLMDQELEPISVNEVSLISPAGPDDEETFVDEEYYECNDISLLEDQLENETGEEDHKKFIQLQHADFLNRLSNFKFIPAKTVTQISEEYLKTSLKSKSLREKKLRAALSELPNVSMQMIEDIVAKTIVTDEYLEAQIEFSSSYKRTKFVAENFKYINPVGLVLNQDEVKMGAKPDYVHYIPVIESFKHLVEDESFIHVMNQEREKPRKDGDVICDFTDGVAFQENIFFKNNPGAFAAHFYSDAVEVSNPLG